MTCTDWLFNHFLKSSQSALSFNHILAFEFILEPSVNYNLNTVVGTFDFRAQNAQHRSIFGKLFMRLLWLFSTDLSPVVWSAQGLDWQFSFSRQPPLVSQEINSEAWENNPDDVRRVISASAADNTDDVIRVISTPARDYITKSLCYKWGLLLEGCGNLPRRLI